MQLTMQLIFLLITSMLLPYFFHPDFSPGYRQDSDGISLRRFRNCILRRSSAPFYFTGPPRPATCFIAFTSVMPDSGPDFASFLENGMIWGILEKRRRGSQFFRGFFVEFFYILFFIDPSLKLNAIFSFLRYFS